MARPNKEDAKKTYSLKFSSDQNQFRMNKSKSHNILSLMISPLAIFQFWAACAVQLLMLFQAGITYILLRRNNKTYPLPINLIPLEKKSFITNKMVSVIIPAYNEALNIEHTLKVVAKRCSDPLNLEIIIVDAGGQDGTMIIVSRIAQYIRKTFGISIRFDIKARGGRGPTLNAGAQVAKGNILLFLHADTILPIGFDDILRFELKNEQVLATAFRFKVCKQEQPIVGVGVMEATVYIRSRVYELPFGDQALALTRQRFNSIGGFPNEPIMEDFELVQKLRRCSAGGGGYIKTLIAPAECSARRWEKFGVWRTNLTNQMVMMAYVYGGYTPENIYYFYYQFNLYEWLESLYYKLVQKYIFNEIIYNDDEGVHEMSTDNKMTKNKYDNESIGGISISMERSSNSDSNAKEIQKSISVSNQKVMSWEKLEPPFQQEEEEDDKMVQNK